MKIRPARPDDVDAVVPLMYSSGPELYDFMYAYAPASSLDYIAFEFKSGRGLCGYKNVTVAEVDGQVVATGCFFDGGAYPALLGGGLANLFRYFGVLKAVPALLRARHVNSVIKPPKNDELYLTNFGVHEAGRGMGIGSAMLAEKILQARDEGYRLFSLDVADNNPRAEKLYRRHGMEQVAFKKFSGEHPSISVPSVRKMEMLLQTT